MRARRAGTAPGTSASSSAPDPKILNPRDAIVRVTATAICGSDLHLYDGYIPTMQAGDILGHEFMGEVVEVGPGVDDPQAGRPRGRAVRRSPAAAAGTASKGSDLALRQLEPERLDGARRCTASPAPGSSATRTSTAATRAGRPSTCACRSPTSGRSRSPTVCRRAGPVPVRHLPHRLHGGGELRHPARRHRRGVGLRPGRAVRDPERLLLGAERVIAIDRFPERLRLAETHAKARDDRLRGGRRRRRGAQAS